MNFNAQELTVIGTLTGAFIGGLFTFLASWISKRSEERKYYRELIIKVASEHWSHEIDTVVKTGGGRVQPFDVYMVHLLQLAKLLEKRNLTPDSVVDSLKDVDKVTQAAINYKIQYSKTKQVE